MILSRAITVLVALLLIPAAVLAQHDRRVNAITISADGTLAASADLGRKIIIWDAVTKREKMKITHDVFGLSAVVFSPDGKSLISAGQSRFMRIWEVATGFERGTLTVPAEAGGTPRSLAWSPDGKVVLVGLTNGTVVGWNMTKPDKTFLNLSVARGAVLSMNYSADGSLVAIGTEDKTVQVRTAPNPAAGANVKMEDRFPRRWSAEHPAGREVRSVSLSPDNKQIAAGGATGAESTDGLQVWNWQERRAVPFAPRTGHKGTVESVAFATVAGRVNLASAGADSKINLWRVSATEFSSSGEQGEQVGITAMVLAGSTARLMVSSVGEPYVTFFDCRERRD